jgi:hypothetical protein
MTSPTPPQTRKLEDKALLSALKLCEKAGGSGTAREKAKSQADEVSARLPNLGERAACVRISEYFLTRRRMKEIGQPIAPPLTDILELGHAGLIQSCDFAWANVGDAVFDFPIEELLSAAPSVQTIEPFSRKHRDLIVRALALVTDHPEIADCSAVYDWLAQRAKPKDLTKLAGLLISDRIRSRHLPPGEDVLRTALLRDKAGDLLRACLGIAKENPPAFDRLRVTLVGTPKLVEHFIGCLPKTISGPNGDVAARMFEAWLPSFPETAVTARETLSGSLLTLAGQLLLLPKRKEIQNRLLELLANNVLPCLLVMEQAGATGGFWLLGRAQDLAEARKPTQNISRYGAGLLASSLEKAKSGFSAEPLLQALALNLGLEPISTAGENVSFDPTIHEDIAGGLLESNPARIVESGWRLRDEIIRRAKVTPLNHA